MQLAQALYHSIWAQCQTQASSRTREGRPLGDSKEEVHSLEQADYRLTTQSLEQRMEEKQQEDASRRSGFTAMAIEMLLSLP